MTVSLSLRRCQRYLFFSTPASCGAPGMLADIIAVPGNPLDHIAVTKDVRFVMLGGRVVKHVMDGRDMHSGGR